MKLDSVRIFFCLSLLCAFLTGQVHSQELKIDRKERLLSYLQDGDEILKRWIKVGDDLFKGRFVVPSHFLNQAVVGIEGDGKNPFADPPTGPTTKRTAKQFLEDYGVEFGKGAEASYNSRSSILTVIQNREQMTLVESYLSFQRCYNILQIPIRVEIYELPSLLALELIESCEEPGDHTPERNAVLKLVKKGEAKLIAMPSLIARSGQRSKITDTYDVPFVEGTVRKPKKGEQETAKGLLIGVRPVGTILEVDPVLGADGRTIDLSLKLEHDTASPEFFPVANKSDAPLFHRKEILTMITILKGNFLLIGNWKPSGKPEYAEKDLTHVIFVTANVQDLDDYGVLQPVENDKTKDKK